MVPSLAEQPGPVAEAGEIVWHDLVTPDIEAALAFYGDLFDWSFEPSGTGYYAIYSEQKLMGGIVDGARLGTTPQTALWLMSIGVADVRESMRSLTAAGGTVVGDVRNVPDRGVFVQVEDPGGAIIQLVRIGPRSRLPDRETWLWYDLLTDAPEKSAEWYGDLPRVEARSGDEPGQFILSAEGSEFATISDTPFEATRSVWLPVLAVADVEEVVRMVPELGGRVVVPPREEWAGGALALLLDPSGGVFAIQNREVLR